MRNYAARSESTRTWDAGACTGGPAPCVAAAAGRQA